MSRHRQNERGAVAVIVGLMGLFLASMAAFAVDVGVTYDTRRSAQAAVDIGLLGGAQEVPFGLVQASERVAVEIRSNLGVDFTDDEWNAMWGVANCQDADKFDTLGSVNGVTTNCISFDDTGRVRVRLPDLEVPAIFSGIFGADAKQISAQAEVFVRFAGIGGVLPFTVLGGAEDGSQICLRSASGGAAVPPCDGSESGNFHALDISIYGDAAFETAGLPCNTNKNDVFTINIAKGIDHLLRVHTGIGVTDSCAKPFGPNQFFTLTGIGNGLWQGLVSGEDIGGNFFEGRLTNLVSSGQTMQIEHEGTDHTVSNAALWSFIPLGFGPAEAPVSCHRETFDAMSFVDATANIPTCLTDYKDGVDAGFAYAPLFTNDADSDGEFDIETSPRFAIVPKTVEDELPRGKKVVQIAGFKAVWVQGLYFPTGGDPEIIEAGDPRAVVSVPNGGSPLDQVTGYLLPDSTVESIIGLLDEAGGEVSGSNVIELVN